MSITEGLQLPVILFVDVVANAGTASPAQMIMLVPKPNVGVTTGSTVTTNVAVVAHGPGSGVNI